MNADDRNVFHVVRPLGVAREGREVVVNNAEEMQDFDCEPCRGESGTRMFRKMQDPKAPSPEEIADHNLSHLPYRSWCRHCVRGKCKEMPHYKSKDEPLMNEVHFDFAFLGKEGQPGKLLPVLVVKERLTGMVMASAVPTKSTGTFITRRTMAYLKEIGCEFGDLIAKSDQEPAVMVVVSDVGKLRSALGGGKYITENSPVGSHPSNGVVERAIQTVTAQARVMLDALETGWALEIPYAHPILCCIRVVCYVVGMSTFS